MKKRMLLLASMLIMLASVSRAGTCTPVAVDTWANHADDGKGPTEVWTLHRNSTNTNWSTTIYPGNPNVGPINAAADTYTFSVEFGADGEGWTTINSSSGQGACQLPSWNMAEYTGLSVKDLNTGITTNFANTSNTYENCTGFACQFHFTNGNNSIKLVSGHDYIFYAGIESSVFDIGVSGVWTYSLRVNVQ